jgi:hypothetical protein
VSACGRSEGPVRKLVKTPPTALAAVVASPELASTLAGARQMRVVSPLPEMSATTTESRPETMDPPLGTSIEERESGP